MFTFYKCSKARKGRSHTFVQHKPAKPTKMLRIFASDIKKKCSQLRVEAPVSRYWLVDHQYTNILWLIEKKIKMGWVQLEVTYIKSRHENEQLWLTKRVKWLFGG